MATNILQQVANVAANLLQQPGPKTEASNAAVAPQNPSPGTNQIPIPRSVVESLSQVPTPETPPVQAITKVVSPEEISNAKLATQELNPEFLKKIAADLQPTLLKPTGSKEEQIINLTNLITDVLAGENPAIPEFKYDKVLDSQKPAESFLERVIDRYHADATNKDNYPKKLAPEELTKLIKNNLEPLVDLAVKLDNTNLTAQLSNSLSIDLGNTSGYNNRFFSFMRNNNFAKAASEASNDVLTKLVTVKPELILQSMLDNNRNGRLYDGSSGTASALLDVSDKGFKPILDSLTSQPDLFVKALVNIVSKNNNPLIGYNDLTKGRQQRLSQVLEAVKPLETKLTEAPAVTQFSQDKTQVIDYLTKVVNQGSK